MFAPALVLPLAQSFVPPPAPAGEQTMLLLAGFGVLLLVVLVVLLRRRDRTAAAAPAQAVLIDGSNVMHWQENTPRIEPLKQVVAELSRLGLRPGVVFDANAGYKLVGRYLNEAELARMLLVPVGQILVVPKGSQADPWLLATARDLQAQIVTNDRYRDWVTDYPELAEPGLLVTGGIEGGRVWLEGLTGK